LFFLVVPFLFSPCSLSLAGSFTCERKLLASQFKCVNPFSGPSLSHILSPPSKNSFSLVVHASFAHLPCFGEVPTPFFSGLRVSRHKACRLCGFCCWLLVLSYHFFSAHFSMRFFPNFPWKDYMDLWAVALSFVDGKSALFGPLIFSSVSGSWGLIYFRPFCVSLAYLWRVAEYAQAPCHQSFLPPLRHFSDRGCAPFLFAPIPPGLPPCVPEAVGNFILFVRQ